MAVRTRSAYKATKNSRYTANTTGDISSGDGADTFEDTADSMVMWEDDVLDEDDMSSDSDVHVPTQQSVKAYVDAQVGGAAQYIDVSVSSSDILALHTTPKELIAAPGANKMIKILHAVIVYTFGTTQYTAGGLPNLSVSYYGDGSHGAMSVPSSVLTQAASCMAPCAAATTLIPFSEGENEGISVIAASQLSSGDGTAQFKIWYEIIDLV